MTKEEERAIRAELAEHGTRLANLERIITAMTATAITPPPKPPQGKKYSHLTPVS